MKVIGLTGGIGAGKSIISELFNILGISVYNSDTRAKTLTSENLIIKEGLIDLFGDEVFLNNEINRAFLANKIFSNPVDLKKVNDLIHPQVHEDFNRWIAKHRGHSPYLIKEAAVMLNHGRPSNLDYIITVTAPEFVRKQNIMTRDVFRSESEIDKIFKIQTPQAVLEGMSDFVINNDGSTSLIEQVNRLHQILSK